MSPMAPSPIIQDRRQKVPAEPATIHPLERDTLNEAQREIPGPKVSATIRLGPHQKDKCWEGAPNRSSHTPTLKTAPSAKTPPKSLS